MIVYSHPYNNQDYDPAAPVMEVVIGKSSEDTGTPVTALIDSGADATMMPTAVLETINARYLETRRMRAVIGQPIVVDMYLIVVQVGPYTIPGIEAIAMHEGTEAIIGRDVLNQLVMTLNGPAHEIEIS
jgi:predicted aspartyl protease